MSNSIRVMRISWVVILSFVAFTASAFSSRTVTEVYKERADVEMVPIVVPTVIEIPLDNGSTAQGEYVIVEHDTDQFVPSYARETYVKFESGSGKVVQGLRFLAQPGETYTVYRKPDHYVSAPYGPKTDLTSDAGVRVVLPPVWGDNPEYVVADVDRDGISNLSDNCPVIANADQKDVDKNGIGDACEDFDRDHVMNDRDNCSNIPNPNQSDVDGDGVGDLCDTVENRLTERYPWVPWVGMGIAGSVLVLLFVLVSLAPKKSVPHGE